MIKIPRSGSIQMPDEPPLKDEEIEDFVGHLWENIDALPCHIQELLRSSQQSGKKGAISYAILAGWALGKFDYEVGDPWFGTKSGWVPKDKDVN
jgi:hypothetical protein